MDFFNAWGACLAALLLLLPLPARAQQAEAEESAAAPPKIAPKTPVPPEYLPAHRLHWEKEWRRVGIPEYTITTAAVAGYLALSFGIKDEEDPDWDNPILLDTEVRDWLRFRSREGRDRAAFASDTLAIASAIHPLIVDTVFVTWIGDSNPDVAWQMEVINLQAYSVGILANQLTKRLTARTRPYTDECESDPNYTSGCDSASAYKSFYSGHSVVAGTSAGLVCAHHTHLPLYGGGFADLGTCLTAVAFTLGTGTLRVASDNHWASDVLVGGVSGYLVGYLVPTLVYYRGIQFLPEATGAAGRVAVLPMYNGNAATLNAIGLF